MSLKIDQPTTPKQIVKKTPSYLLDLTLVGSGAITSGAIAPFVTKNLPTNVKWLTNAAIVGGSILASTLLKNKMLNKFFFGLGLGSVIDGLNQLKERFAPKIGARESTEKTSVVIKNYDFGGL